MEIFLTGLGIVLYVWLFVTFLQRTFLAISAQRHQISGAIFLANDCLFVLPALLIVLMVGPLNIRILHYVEPSSVFLVNAIVLMSLWAFVMTLSVISRLVGAALCYDLREVYRELQHPVIVARLLAFNRVMMISIPVAILTNSVVFGGQHALFSAAFYDLNPGAIRHLNESSAFAAYAKHYFHVVSLLMAPCLALPVYKVRKLERAVALILIFMALTSHGSKSPFVFFLLVFVFALIEKAALNAGKTKGSELFTPQRIMTAALSLSLVFLAFYWTAVTFFLGEGTGFWDYFWNRAFVGQMAGVYEQFNLLIYDPAFSWHGVPFASMFMDYPNFHKELMLISENRVDPDKIGIKVTFFAAEAYGMFGWVGVILAPVMLATQFTVTFVVLNFVIDNVILRSRELSKYVTCFFFASYFSFTDGISEMILLKGALLVLILASPIMICMAVRGTWISHKRRQGASYAM